MRTALLCGALAGCVLFVLQHFAVTPLILAAETYEHDHGHESSNRERTAYTALTAILTGIAFAAIFVAAVEISGQPLNVRRGALFGLAAFASLHLAPAIGLP